MPKIRSVKPEFWSDSKTGTLTPLATKLFIGILNFADDEGVIRYDIDEIKAKIFPYETQGSDFLVSPLVKELLPKGLLILFESSGVQYLVVRNFSKHQIINRHSAPLLPGLKITDIEKSLKSDRKNDGTLQSYCVHISDTLEERRGEGEEKERKGEGEERTEKKKDPAIPQDLQASTDVILKWLAYKRERGQTYKPKGLEGLWSTIRKIHEDQRVEAIETSIGNNWSGIFPPKGGRDGKVKSPVAGAAAPVPDKYSHLG